MFRQISDRVFVSPQIAPAELAGAAAQGITLVINNRPDGEAPDQPDGAEIERAALAHGMAYRAIPISHAGFSQPQVAAMAEALAAADGGVLAFCRSGTRSALLWALAEASRGESPHRLAAAAAAAGYDVAPVRAVLDMLAAGPQ